MDDGRESCARTSKSPGVIEVARVAHSDPGCWSGRGPLLVRRWRNALTHGHLEVVGRGVTGMESAKGRCFVGSSSRRRIPPCKYM